MRCLLLALPLLLAGGCASSPPPPYSPVGTVHYSAMGQDPFWLVTIGDDRIVLRLAGESGQAPTEAVWPRTLPRTWQGTTIWESGDGTQVIAIASRPGPCTDARGLAYADEVRVRLSGRELRGCGGRLLRS